VAWRCTRPRSRSRTRGRLLAATARGQQPTDLDLDTGTCTGRSRGDQELTSQALGRGGSHAPRRRRPDRSVHHTSSPRARSAPTRASGGGHRDRQGRLIRHVTWPTGTVLTPCSVRGPAAGGIAQGVAQACTRKFATARRTATADQHARGLRPRHRGRAAQRRVDDQRGVTPRPNRWAAKGIGEDGTIGSTTGHPERLSSTRVSAHLGVRHIDAGRHRRGSGPRSRREVGGPVRSYYRQRQPRPKPEGGCRTGRSSLQCLSRAGGPDRHQHRLTTPVLRGCTVCWTGRSVNA